MVCVGVYLFDIAVNISLFTASLSLHNENEIKDLSRREGQCSLIASRGGVDCYVGMVCKVTGTSCRNR